MPPPPPPPPPPTHTHTHTQSTPEPLNLKQYGELNPALADYRSNILKTQQTPGTPTPSTSDPTLTPSTRGAAEGFKTPVSNGGVVKTKIESSTETPPNRGALNSRAAYLPAIGENIQDKGIQDKANQDSGVSGQIKLEPESPGPGVSTPPPAASAEAGKVGVSLGRGAKIATGPAEVEEGAVEEEVWGRGHWGRGRGTAGGGAGVARGRVSGRDGEM